MSKTNNLLNRSIGDMSTIEILSLIQKERRYGKNNLKIIRSLEIEIEKRRKAFLDNNTQTKEGKEQ